DGVVHVDLVAVAFDPRAKRRVHVLHRIEVARRDHDEVGRHGFGLDHRPRGTLALPRDTELALLDRRHQLLLGAYVEGVDLVEEQYSFVRLVDRTGLDAVVTRRLHPARLERVVTDVAEQRAGVGT